MDIGFSSIVASRSLFTQLVQSWRLDKKPGRCEGRRGSDLDMYDAGFSNLEFGGYNNRTLLLAA